MICSGYNIYIDIYTISIIVSDVMVLNDIIEQAAGRQSRGSEKAGMLQTKWFTILLLFLLSL